MTYPTEAGARRSRTGTAVDQTLSNSAAAVLGMVTLGARSGYEIRRAAELSLRFFWALGPPQIYSELTRLEEAGLVEGHDDSQGRRPRRRYETTERGRSALKRWVTAPQDAALELRDALLLQLFFADAVDSADVTGLLVRIRDRSTRALVAFEDRIAPAAAHSAERGFVQPAVVAEFGQAFHEFIVGWCEQRLGNG